MNALAVSDTFSKAITLIEFEKSGNPQEKYRPGGSILRMFIREAMKTGSYIPYIEQVFAETEQRLPELEEEIEAYNNATFSVSLEHSDPDAYRKMRLLEALEEDA